MKKTRITLAALAAAALFTPCQAQDSSEKPKRTPEEIFAKLDKDGNKSLSKDEFMASKKAQQDPEKAAKKFGKLDADGNGSVSLDEFKAGAAKKSDDSGKAAEAGASNE